MPATQSSDSPQRPHRGAATGRQAARRPTANVHRIFLPHEQRFSDEEPASATVLPRPLDRFWRDCLIAGCVAATLHLGVLFGFNDHSSKAPAKAVTPEEPVAQLEMPVLEPPDEVEIVEVTDAPTSPQMAPPMLMDMPSTVTVSNFVQPLRPAVDPSLMSVGAFTIPTVTTAAIGGSAGVRLFDLKDLDRVPRRVRTKMPEYPHELRRAGIKGDVVLLVIIDVNGRVEVERVISSTHREFEVAAVKAAEQCVFESPLRAGQRVNARYTWNIPFDLK
jgi:protein TonB